MSVSKSFVKSEINVQEVLTLYLEDSRKLTLDGIAKEIGTTFHNVHWIVNRHVDGERLRAEKALRYSRSKVLDNPMRGKHGSSHHNYKGLISDGKGYLMRKVDGRYVLEHRRVFAVALGLESLPPWLDVHHIDEDKTNNSLDNLALVTKSGHGKLHVKLSPSERLPLWERWESGTLPLPMTTRTALAAS